MKSWTQQRQSEKCRHVLRAAIPVLVCTLLFVAAIVSADLGLWAAEKKQATVFVGAECTVTKGRVNDLVCSR